MEKERTFKNIISSYACLVASLAHLKIFIAHYLTEIIKKNNGVIYSFGNEQLKKAQNSATQIGLKQHKNFSINEHQVPQQK